MSWMVHTVILPVTVICLGLVSSVGYVTGSSSVLSAGLASAASPLPLPFYDIAGTQENFSYRVTLSYTTADGQTYDRPLHTRDLVGPHRRKIAYVTALQSYRQLVPVSAYALVQGFCRSDASFLKQPLASTPSRIYIHLYGRTDDDTPALSVPFVCPN